MRYMLIAAATVALVGAATLASAQAPDDKGKGPPSEGKGSAQDGRGMQREPGRDQPKAEQPGKDRPRATEQPGDRPKASEQPGKDRPRATERPDRDRPKATERPDNDRPKASEQRPGTKEGARVRVSDQERRGVRERLTQTKIEKTRVNVSVNIGATLPRSVRLHPLPATVISIAPAYRGYNYVLLDDDTIVIVDARTYVIVDVLPAGTRRADHGLVLSTEQMRFIYDRVPRNRTADIRVRLALGAEVPRGIELLSFPREVVERVPDVGRYRFVVAANDVVIVDPTDHEVVLVISE